MTYRTNLRFGYEIDEVPDEVSFQLTQELKLKVQELTLSSVNLVLTISQKQWFRIHFRARFPGSTHTFLGFI